MEVEAISKTYSRRRRAPERAADSLDLIVGEGGVHGFLGPEAQAQELRALSLEDYQACLDETPPDQQETCGFLDDWTPTAEDFLDATPFNPDGGLRVLVGFAGAVAAFVGFLVAATTGGADWTARSMRMLLVWEPSRTRVFLVRLAVLAVGALGLALASLLLATLLGAGVVGLRGRWERFGSEGWADLMGYELRLLPLVVLATAGGFGLAMVARSTGFALGVAAGYLAFVESVAQIWAWGSEWLVQTNVGVALSGTPVEWVVSQMPLSGPEPSSVLYEVVTVTITPVRALLTLLAIVLAVNLLALVLYRRRDLS